MSARSSRPWGKTRFWSKCVFPSQQPSVPALIFSGVFAALALALALAHFITQYCCTGRCLRALTHVEQGISDVMVPLFSFGAQVNPEGKYVVDLDKSIDVTEIKPNLRVALRNDSYVLHKV
jgi:hypothetical protein